MEEKMVRMESWVTPRQKAKANRLGKKLGSRSAFIRKLINDAK